MGYNSVRLNSYYWHTFNHTASYNLDNLFGIITQADSLVNRRAHTSVTKLVQLTDSNVSHWQSHLESDKKIPTDHEPTRSPWPGMIEHRTNVDHLRKSEWERERERERERKEQKRSHIYSFFVSWRSHYLHLKSFPFIKDVARQPKPLSFSVLIKNSLQLL